MSIKNIELNVMILMMMFHGSLHFNFVLIFCCDNDESLRIGYNGSEICRIVKCDYAKSKCDTRTVLTAQRKR